MVMAVKALELGKAAEVYAEMMNVSKEGIRVTMKLCQQALDGKGMSEEWHTCRLVPTTRWHRG